MPSTTYKEAMDSAAAVITLTINNSQPVRLSDFVHAFTSLAEEYRQTVRDSDDFVSDDAEIYIKEIRSGSIIADLIPVAASVIPLVAHEVDRVFLAVELVERWRSKLTDLAKGIVPENASKNELKHWLNAVEAIARDPDASSTLEASVYEDGKREVRASFSFRTHEARQIENTIEKEIQRLESKKQADHERVLMVFTRSDVGDAPVGKRSGERVVISEISEKPLAITYGSELAEQRIKHEIRESDENIYKKGFNVDVKLQSSGSRPVAYSIINVHDVVDLPDE